MARQGDIALQNALERAKELRSRIAAAEASLVNLNQQLKSDTSELRQLHRFIASAHALANYDGLPAARPKNPDRRDVAEKALQLIRAARRPLPRRELYERLTAAGVTINGKDPEMVLGTMLYRDDRIVRIRGHGYWPKEEVYDPAFYLPEHETIIGATDSSNELGDGE